MNVIDITPLSREKAEKIRLAAYARVSSKSEEQLHSFAAQVQYYSEYVKDHPEYELIDIYADPYLAGTLGAAFINGLQSTGASACVKHYCCYNQETNRFTQRVFVDEDVMMNVYVRVFRILLNKSAPDFLMTAYNAVNGKFVSENKNLLKYVLRKLLGYKGTVISDWGGMDYRSKSLKAGVDVNMPGDVDTSWKEVVKTIENGDLTEKELDESFGRVCAALRRALKEKPLKETDMSLLGKIASESIVLLKNEGEI